MIKPPVEIQFRLGVIIAVALLRYQTSLMKIKKALSSL